jgi:hypothetical protein
LLYNWNKKNPEREKDNNLKHQKQMTTKLTVTPATNGTLKQNRNLSKRLMQFAASFFFSVIALTAMSFTQDDTTKKAEDKTITQLTNSADDSCCVVNFVNGMQHFSFRNKPSFAVEIHTNAAALKTWAQNFVYMSNKAAALQSINVADNNIDLVFTDVEMINRNKAIAFSNYLKDESLAADADLNEVFNQTVAAPQFVQSLNTETAEADASMDKNMADELENRVKAVLFSKTIGVEKQAADNDMDYMVNASALQNISPFTGSDADQQIDDLLAKNTFKSVYPMNAIDADRIMDDLLKNRN